MAKKKAATKRTNKPRNKRNVQGPQPPLPDPPKTVEELRAFLEKLNLERTPDKPAPRRPRIRGKVHGLGFGAFLYLLFDANERLPRERKMTNAEIERQIAEEFSHHPKTVARLKKDATVNYHRHAYNRGLLSNPQGAIPELISYRYDEEGHRVDGRTGKRKLTEQEAIGIEAKYRSHYRGMQKDGTIRDLLVRP